GLLEHHDALVGLVTEQLQRGKATGRPHVQMRSAARGHDNAFFCVHDDVLSSTLISPAPCSARRHLTQPLMDETPAVALGIERLVGAWLRAMAARLPRDPRTRGAAGLEVRLDVGDGHAEVLALDAAALRADGTVGALRADPDHAVAELDERVVDHT